MLVNYDTFTYTFTKDYPTVFISASATIAQSVSYADMNSLKINDVTITFPRTGYKSYNYLNSCFWSTPIPNIHAGDILKMTCRGAFAINIFANSNSKYNIINPIIMKSYAPSGTLAYTSNYPVSVYAGKRFYITNRVNPNSVNKLSLCEFNSSGTRIDIKTYSNIDQYNSPSNTLEIPQVSAFNDSFFYFATHSGSTGNCGCTINFV